ncbi:MAG: response regulator transcription factor [Bacteroidia bacterium]|nr:response regulator transcription factor [Bacteroidia bacterium]
MKIRTILIDDEPKALAILEEKLARSFGQIEVVKSYRDPEQALEELSRISPQLIFLDIAMPRMSGFDFLERIPDPKFEIIFVTAFGDYAIEAIKHCAIGYVVKPIVNEELETAVNNAMRNIERNTTQQQNDYLLNNLRSEEGENKKLVIPVDDGLIFSEYKDIVRFEGETGYTRIHFTNGSSILSAYNIGYYYSVVSKKVFFQVHKSHIVNISHITRYFKDGLIELRNQHQVPLSRRKRDEFLAIFTR